MKKSIFALFSICVIAISCKKDHPDPVASTSLPYSNSTVGSNWIYELKTQDQTTLDTIVSLDTSSVINGDTTIGSKNYTRVEHKNGSHTYYNVTGNDYFQFQHFVIPATIDTSIEALYLKDNVAMGGSWNQALNVTVNIGIPVTLTITITSTITGTGLSRTVNGNTYNDVISVGTTLSAPGVTITSNINNYYARNIGLIEGNYDIDVSGFGGVHNSTSLKYADPR
ncbi:MAG: hypothetical protein ABI402_13005 [Ferruginibacter sp.]